MPPVKISRTNGAPSADVSPQEAAQIRASTAGKEQAPSQEQLAAYVSWRQAMDTLGDPYNVEQIPISKLRMMRRDPIIGFGLSFIKTPHVRARWYIDAKDANGPNAQIAAHLDHDLRRIMASLVLTWCNSLDFGFQAASKRFEFRVPSGTYVAQDQGGTLSEQPIWSQGNIQPIAWKPFVALPPETVEPIWGGDGSFNGIDYDGSQQGGASPPGGTGATPKGNNKFKIDLIHSLWITNERDQNFGSIFGYPRLGYAYRAWWSYWFRWAIADRAFEKKADPSIVIRHPEGHFVDPTTGQQVAYSDYALTIGNRMRSGGIITIPSTPYEGVSGYTNIQEWGIDSTGELSNFDPFDKSFDYLDIAKMRALWIPEQSLTEGKGGTSSRNVAAEMSSSFTESQAVMSSQIAETINRWVIPQWLAVNYPEFLQSNGTAQVIIQGFADEDVAFTQQILQLIGQQVQGVNKILTMIDLQKILDDAGVPILDIKSQQAEAAALVQQEQTQGQPPSVTPRPGPNGSVGVVPAGGNGVPPVTPPSEAAAPSSTGFAEPQMVYVQPREVIYLSDGSKRPKITVKRTSDLPEGIIARYDDDTQTVLFSETAPEKAIHGYLSEIGKVLVSD